MEKQKIKVAIYGGNGFVGTHLAKSLSEAGVDVTCLSRTGHKPVHLDQEQWSQSVNWCEGNANEPDLNILSTMDVLIMLVGAAPLPTFSKSAFDQQVHNNGIAPSNAIEGAHDAGIKRVILLGAKLPALINKDFFGYAKGKKIALSAAQAFVEKSNMNSALVLQPATIYGKRQLKNGITLPLDKLLYPAIKLMPSQFTSIDTLVERMTLAVTQFGDNEGGLKLLQSHEI